MGRVKNAMMLATAEPENTFKTFLLKLFFSSKSSMSFLNINVSSQFGCSSIAKIFQLCYPTLPGLSLMNAFQLLADFAGAPF